MEFCNTKIMVRFRKDAWVGGVYHSTNSDRETAILSISQGIAAVVNEYLKRAYPEIGFAVRVKKGSHKAKEVMRQDRYGL